ncbi:MAG: GxxExxY protein [Gammaproteobacteria bacterium]
MSNEVTKNIISAAIEVHRHLGPGLLESIYESALCHEFDIRKLSYEKQKQIEVIYKGMPIKGQRIDIVVENEIIVELKATHHFNEVFISQTLSYLKASGLSTALIINFAKSRLIEGIKRVSL